MFVESYGKVAVEGSSFSPRVDAVLDRGPGSCGPPASRPAAAGSPRRRSAASAGWRTPRCSRGSGSTASGATTSSSRATGSRSARPSGGPAGGPSTTCRRTTGTGRRGRRSTTTTRSTTGGTSATAARRFAYAPMPDQYVFLALQRLELAKTDRRPLFAEVDLVSSHTPWTRIPPLIGWNRGRRRLGLQPPAGRHEPALQATRTRAGVRPVDPVLTERAVLVRAALRRRRTSCWSCWATTSPPHRQRRERQPRRADLDHRPRPGGAATRSPAGDGRTACARPRRRRSGR